MDPTSIAAAAASLVFTIVKTGKTLAAVFSERETAPQCVLLIQTEFVVLAAAFSQIQHIFGATIVRNYPETLVWALELTVVGCELTLFVMNKKIDGLRGLETAEDIALEKSEKSSHIWNEGLMTRSLEHIKDQSSAVAILLRALDCWSMDGIVMIVESGHPTFKKIEQETARIREAYPGEGYATSIQQMSTQDLQAVYSLLEPDSTSSTTSQRVFLRGPRFTQSAMPSSSRSEEIRGEGPSTMAASRPHGRRRGLKAVESTPTPSSENSFLEDLAALQQKMMAPALALGIVAKEGSSTYLRGARKHGSAVPVTRVDRFGVAGVSYMMISTLLVILIDKGLLDWDTTIKDALPDMAEVIHPDHHETTLEMLCAHISGIQTSVWDIEEGKVWDDLKHLPGHEGRIMVARAILAIPPAQTPGRNVSWNENNMLIVALVLEERASEIIENLLKRELFDPLGMSSTAANGVGKGNERDGMEEPKSPWPHALNPDGDEPIPREPALQAGHIPAAYQPLDNIHSSMPDLLKFFQVQHAAFFDLSTFLPNPSSFQKLHTLFPGTDRTPGGWCGTTSDLRMAESFHGWSVSVSMLSSTKEVYICLTNVGSAFSDFVPEEFKEVEELCMRRPSDIAFQNRTF